MGSKAKAASGGDKTKKQTPAEQIRDNFLQFTSGRPNIMSDSMVFQRPDGKLEGVNVNFDPFMSELLAGARSGKNVGPPSQTMPPVFIPPQAPPSELFKDSVLNTLETVQLPPSVRDKPEEKKVRPFPLPEGIPFPIPVPVPTMPGPFLPPPPPRGFNPENPPRSDRNLLPFVLPLPVGIGSLFREFLEGLQEEQDE